MMGDNGRKLELELELQNGNSLPYGVSLLFF
jgi:hypothetical protein